jgi:hypothetical protein
MIGGLMTYCIVVRASGRELDRLRTHAAQIARDQKSDWWVETTEKGKTFCFEHANARASFSAVCEGDSIQFSEV